MLQHRADRRQRAVLVRQRHDALVRLLSRQLVLRVERDGKAAVAVRVDQVGQRGVVGDLGALGQLGGGAHRQVGQAFHHQHPHRAVAVQLHHQRAVELQVGRQQCRGGHHLAQQAADRRGVAVAAQHFLPGGFHAHQLAAHGSRVEQEFLQGVGGGGIGHNNLSMIR
ncbi:hypothetical protein D3C72_1439660 [compost metagenome]